VNDRVATISTGAASVNRKERAGGLTAESMTDSIFDGVFSQRPKEAATMLLVIGSILTLVGGISTPSPSHAVPGLEMAQLKSDLKDSSFYLSRGLSLVKKGDTTLALSDFDQAIRIKPTDVEARLARGYALLDLNDPDRAALDFAQVTSLNPGSAAGFIGLGKARSAGSDSNGALTAFTMAISLDGNSAAAYLGRATCWRNLGEPAKATSDLNKAAALSPSSPEIFLARGEILLAAKNYAGATVDFDRSLSLDPNNATAYLRRGEAAIWLHANDQAISDLDQALTLATDPGAISDALTLRGGIWLTKSDYSRAISDYSDAIARNPQNIDATARRGLAYERSGATTQAIADYGRVLQLSPKSSEIYFARGMLYYKGGNMESAIADFDRCAALDTNRTDVIRWRGIARFDSGDQIGAMADLAAANKTYPDDQNIRSRYLSSLLAVGDDKFRQADYNGAIERYSLALALTDRPSHIKAKISSAEVERDNNLVSWGGDSSHLYFGPPRINHIPGVPALVASGYKFTDISIGGIHACGIIADGSVLCWGYIEEGEEKATAIPTPIPGNYRFSKISAGGGYTCGITMDSQVACWGGRGLRRGSDFQASPALIPLDGIFIDVSVGSDSVCVIRNDGSAFCWGNGEYGNLGDGTTQSRTTPTPVAGNLRFKQISTYQMHTCAITLEGHVACWGRGGMGELGAGKWRDSATPILVEDTSEFIQVSVGWSFSCGIHKDHHVFCWGDNRLGHLGDNSGQTISLGPDHQSNDDGSRNLPAPVFGNYLFAQISADFNSTCGVLLDGRAVCWGANFSGLGNRDTEDTKIRSTPTLVAGDFRFSKLSHGLPTFAIRR
jgi:tetratricopeptide (TPR) repeat protein/alpha-tubulin suppressor-like RCC1 family protein